MRRATLERVLDFGGTSRHPGLVSRSQSLWLRPSAEVAAARHLERHPELGYPAEPWAGVPAPGVGDRARDRQELSLEVVLVVERRAREHPDRLRARAGPDGGDPPALPPRPPPRRGLRAADPHSPWRGGAPRRSCRASAAG